MQRVRGYFGADDSGNGTVPFEDTKPFHPKVVVYDIFSPDGTYADINYLTSMPPHSGSTAPACRGR